MSEEKEKREILSKCSSGKELLRKILPIMKSELVGFTEEINEGLLFTLPGGKGYKIFIEEI